ncbi:hypothetical protein RQP46_010246 [Phenoliferia psychrophenolica]
MLITVRLPSALFTLLYLTCTPSLATPLPSSGNSAVVPNSYVLAPIYTPPAPSGSASALTTDGHIIRDSYLVILEDHLAPSHVARHHQHVQDLHAQESGARTLVVGGAPERTHGGVKHTFSVGKKVGGKKLHGYSGEFSEHTLDRIRALEGVKYVERDSIVWASEVEKGAPWGLARISHRDPLSFGTFNRYEFDGQGGEGVDAYVIDTGVNIGHADLAGRASWGKTIPKDPDQDLNGHGSHVAGTIAGTKYGVAKQAHIIAVKVLGAGGSGTMSDVVAGVAWAADAAYSKAQAAKATKDSKHKGSVANMSLGGGKSPALDSAVDAAVEDGLHFAVAAGNDNKDACSYSPAASPLAITVGASTIADERAYFSNHGPCVDVFAPGLNILSIWNTGNQSLNTISGTSMASPHVAGLAAYFLSLYPTGFSAATDDFSDSVYAQILGESLPQTSFLTKGAQFVFGAFKGARGMLAPIPPKEGLTPAALKKALLKVSSKGKLTGDLPTGTPNLLIFNNFTTSA